MSRVPEIPDECVIQHRSRDTVSSAGAGPAYPKRHRETSRAQQGAVIMHPAVRIRCTRTRTSRPHENSLAQLVSLSLSYYSRNALSTRRKRRNKKAQRRGQSTPAQRRVQNPTARCTIIHQFHLLAVALVPAPRGFT